MRRKEMLTFHSRKERIAYVAKRFSPLLCPGEGRVLDVGCDQAYLKELCPEAQYTGIDMAPPADIVQDLACTPILPFPDRNFHCVICIDVLEHLESLHKIFEEIIRVCSGFAVISWHNCWVNARRPIDRGHGSFSHYGLPVDPPGDRHRWFFNISEAWNFVQEQQTRLPFTLAEAWVMEKPRPYPVRLLRKMRYLNPRDYDNRYAHTLWTVLARR